MPDATNEASYEDYRPSTFHELRELTRRQRRIAIAILVRSKTRFNGQPLSNVAIASKVRGSTLTEVREVREELEQYGVLVEETEGPPEDREGDK